MNRNRIRFQAEALTDRGLKRASNEDAFGFSAEHTAYVLCDGMGGAAAGEVASAMAVDAVLAALCERGPNTTMEEAGADAVAAANRAIYAHAQADQALNGMGTTMVALIADGNQICVVNVGDSRCYLLHRGALRQVTLDHSFVEEQVRDGRMTPAQAERSPMRNVITRALGTYPEVLPDFFAIDAEPGDLFLLCSDGLTRELTDMTIQSLLAMKGSLHDRCTRLVEAAKRAGGQDNITCLLVQAVA